MARFVTSTGHEFSIDLLRDIIVPMPEALAAEADLSTHEFLEQLDRWSSGPGAPYGVDVDKWVAEASAATYQRVWAHVRRWAVPGLMGLDVVVDDTVERFAPVLDRRSIRVCSADWAYIRDRADEFSRIITKNRGGH